MGEGLETSFWIMILVQTIGSIDMPGYGQRKLPSPRQYVAIIVAWVVLMLVAGIGQQARRAATSVGWLLVLTGFVVGPFGKRVVSLFSSISTNLPSVAPAESAANAAEQAASGITAATNTIGQGV